MLTPLKFNPKVKRLNFVCNLKASAVIKGDKLVSLSRYTANSMMLCSWHKAIVIDLDKMDLLKVININTFVDVNF